MHKISKNRKERIQKMNFSKKYDPKEAIKLLKDSSYVKFNETLDVAIKLSIDTSKTDQNIRGVINLPHGTGKNIRVAVMAKGEKASYESSGLSKREWNELMISFDFKEKIV